MGKQRSIWNEFQHGAKEFRRTGAFPLRDLSDNPDVGNIYRESERRFLGYELSLNEFVSLAYKRWVEGEERDGRS